MTLILTLSHIFEIFFVIDTFYLIILTFDLIIITLFDNFNFLPRYYKLVSHNLNSLSCNYNFFLIIIMTSYGNFSSFFKLRFHIVLFLE